MSDCTLLILTYKGIEHLKHLLPSITEAIKEANNYSVDVIIVDNGRDKNTKEFVNNQFPEFKIEWSTSNDYLFSLNHFVKKINSPFTFILNDDIRMHPKVILETISVIEKDENLFSVGCRVYDWEGINTTISVRTLQIQNGWYTSSFRPIEDEKLRYTLYGAGGAAVFRTDYFNQIGGFNDLFRPAYGEDLDLSHRAWHKGWESIFNPKAILFHREGATISTQFQKNELTVKIFKNKILWMLCNADQKGFLFWFFVLYVYRMLRWKGKNHNLYTAMKIAKLQFKDALVFRGKTSSHKIKDEEISRLLNKVYEPK